MDTVTALRTFAQVVRSGSFSEAARQLNVVPSVVAKRIAQLERSTGRRLFERTTRSVRLTEAGEQLHGRASPLLAEFDEVVHSVRAHDENALAGHLRVMAPTTLTLMHLGATFNHFLRQHRHITLEVSLVDRSANPQEQGYDLAVSGRVASYEGVVDVPLCPTDTLLCASPAYLGVAAAPLAHPRDLADHACLVFRPGGSSWQFRTPRGPLVVEVQARLLADDNRSLLDAAVQGLGLAVLPRYVCAAALQRGEVVQALPEYPLQETWFRAYVPRKRLKVARVAALLDCLKAATQQGWA